MTAHAPGTDIVCLLGPTASGKTAAALEVARRRAARGQTVEIISVDSALVYRGMDIGTAKPTAAERALAPHHLIDIRDPAEAYSAAEFRADTLRLSAEILARGALPLLVGGTMLYYRALTQGLAALPGADPALRATLDAEALTRGWPALHARLAVHDPQTAARLAPNDAQRIQRALEVWMLSGETLSALLAKPAPDTDTAGETHFVPVSLEPSDRSVLHRRIEARFDAMLAGGLVDEVARLRARGDLTAALPAMRCVGYRQVWDYLDGPDGPEAWRIMRDKGVFATRQLCKRQLTWLRSFTGRQVVDCSAPDTVARAADAIEARWDGAPHPSLRR
ncbi:tRNA (adenosine(37)-N6)-dimethylallyltransferase MiaA [Robbsia sp. Bb-Pol-6]|uniref:tRNA dimethylallyltransferase n=1 Tax=Robbsia betulipollinis TaxID=2981849 RepID=A0ABT3ZSE2_9BURK|nr:tRNA (adenosine(37)-N6)-dimethylallyltransferase MiaA [Robbsia betulipollinis]MCY0388818.1 tRNA (adenosine(37)-N6)-dimethylallyltransferase MiaA [Robbsia betulipollinis]